MTSDYLFPLIGIFLGWSLNEISQLFMVRRENKMMILFLKSSIKSILKQ
jgi:hypothetical protein